MKRIIAAILALCALICVSLAVVSCDNAGNGDTVTTTQKEEVTTAAKVTYTVKVVDENGNPVAGAYVQLCEATEEGRCFMPIATDANGVATMELEEGPYKTMVNMAEGYTFSEEYTPFGNEKTVTLTVKAN